MPGIGLLARVDDATAATYHYFGLRIRILDEDSVKAWAYDMIEQRDAPPISIIEIATAPHRDALYEALRIASERGDAQTATRLLLTHLHHELSADRISTASAVCGAMTLCSRNMALEESYFDFLGLDEDIYLNKDDVEGFDENLKAQALSFLATHGLSTDEITLDEQPLPWPTIHTTLLSGGCSVRAASWIAARCIRCYAQRLGLTDSRLFNFCDYLEALISADDIVDWDSRGSMLEITGLGDVPTILSDDQKLISLIEHARKISATQMYSAWTPDVVLKHLKCCLDIAELDLDREIPSQVLAHHPLHHGWGDPIPAPSRQSGRPG